MHIYDFFQHLPYAFEQVATVFWHRYPNTTAKHVISEDFIEVAVSSFKFFGIFLRKVLRYPIILLILIRFTNLCFPRVYLSTELSGYLISRTFESAYGHTLDMIHMNHLNETRLLVK